MICMIYKVGDNVVGKRHVSNKSDGVFQLPKIAKGIICHIPKNRRYVTVDTGKYKECFFCSEIKLIRKR